MTRKLAIFLLTTFFFFAAIAEQCNRSDPQGPNFIQPYEFCSIDFKRQKYPKFSEFSAKKLSEVQPIFPTNIPNANSDENREWLDAIKQTYKDQGQNFSGNFLLVRRGCGAACTLGLIVDLNTGLTYRPKEIAQVIASVNPLPENTLAKLGIEDDVYSFKPDSNLLILIGSIGEMDTNRRGVYHFVWENNKFRLLLKTEKVKKDTP